MHYQNIQNISHPLPLSGTWMQRVRLSHSVAICLSPEQLLRIASISIQDITPQCSCLLVSLSIYQPLKLYQIQPMQPLKNGFSTCFFFLLYICLQLTLLFSSPPITINLVKFQICLIIPNIIIYLFESFFKFYTFY